MVCEFVVFCRNIIPATITTIISIRVAVLGSLNLGALKFLTLENESPKDAALLPISSEKSKRNDFFKGCVTVAESGVAVNSDFIINRADKENEQKTCGQKF